MRRDLTARTSVRLTAATLAVYGLAGPATGAHATTAPKVVVAGGAGLHRIGAFRPGGRVGDFGRAVRVFGPPSRSVALFEGSTCRVTWSQQRVTADFEDTDRRPGSPTVCSSRQGTFTFARLGLGWRTSRGLRVGAPARLIKRLYPAAAFIYGRWWLVSQPRAGGTGPAASEPLLAARVAKGHVISLVASVGTAG
jgi:hypothetical protein